LDEKSFHASGFVGRHQEIISLKAALEEALAGRGMLIALVGEPGIGKTRTAQELAAYASQRSCQVLWGRCYEEQGTPAYWPWIQAIRSYVSQQESESIKAAMGPGASDIAEIIPGLREKLPNLQFPPGLEPALARFRLFDSVTTFLRNAAESQPLMLILDDLQWADPASLLLLEFVAREVADCRLLVLVTYRNVELSRSHPLSETLGGLAREQLFRRIPLRGLAPKELELLIESTADISPGESFARALHSQTDGNPFFAIEVIRALREEGQLRPERINESQALTLSIPQGVREVIGRRLNRLSVECNQVLTMASVIGRTFQLDQLIRLMGKFSEEEAMDALEEGLGASIIEEVPGFANGFQFSHAIIQETLLSELSAVRRMRLHAQVAQALEEMYGVNAEDHAGELAFYFAQAEPVLGPVKLVRYSLIAGEQALQKYAWEEALTLFQRGLSARANQSVDSDTAALLFGVGRAQENGGPNNIRQEAFGNLVLAFDYYCGVGNVLKAVEIAEFPIPITLWRIDGLTQLIPRALELVPPDSLTAGRLLTRYGNVLGIQQGDYEEAKGAFVNALEIAQRQNDPALEIRALVDAARVDRFHLRYQECLIGNLKAIEMARLVDDPQAQVSAHYEASLALMYVGELLQAREHVKATVELAERLRTCWWLYSAYGVQALLSALEGDWQAARGFTDRSLSAAYGSTGRMIARRVVLEYEVGEFSEGKAYLELLEEELNRTRLEPTVSTALGALAIPLVGQITGERCQSDIAETIAKTILSSHSSTPFVAAYARVSLALLAVQRGDQAAAAQQYAELKRFEGLIVGFVAVGRLLGLLARTMGNPDQAIDHFVGAESFCRSAGYHPELAWTCFDYADTLHRRNLSGDREKATSLLDETLSISNELGMRPLMLRVLAVLEPAQPKSGRASNSPEGLTKRELEVLRNAAAGKTNPEIANKLCISVNTVARHFTNIFVKTGTSSRAWSGAWKTGWRTCTDRQQESTPYPTPHSVRQGCSCPGLIRP